MTTGNTETCGDLLFVSTREAWQFTRPESVIVCHASETLAEALRRVDAAIEQGRFVAGYLAYEAGLPLAGVENQPTVPSGVPLLWFGVYQRREPATRRPTTPADAGREHVRWEPALTAPAYHRQFKRIRDYIAAGDVYQINLTFPLTARFSGDALQWFWRLYAAQPTNHAAYLDLGRHKVVSLSPELFFQVEGDVLTARPMKGTCPRGLYPNADAAAQAQLRNSEKDRAENVMIVDLLRNDMGRISTTGSVRVTSLFDVERYATVWQMTSTIESQTDAPFSEIVSALFPCGSVTGAPKIRAMQIIDEIEARPRGVYCGAVGWWGPERRASFNVGIRTLTVDTETEQATYPVGGGVTWYSNADGEYAECIAKAKTVMMPSPAFRLLETLLYDKGYWLLEEHLDRICASADYFDFPVNRAALREALLASAATLSPGRWKVRLLLAQDGAYEVETMPAPESKPVRVALAADPVDNNNVFLYHKTTCRDVYEQALKARPGMDDVLLWNQDHELTESTRANIVVTLNGKMITPPVACGLLAGVMRNHLIENSDIEEAVVRVADIRQATDIFLVNSLRGWMRTVPCNE